MRNEVFRSLGLTASIGENIVFNSLDITIYSGEVLGVLGKYYSGKSSLAPLLSGQMTVLNGSIFYNGQACSPAKPLATPRPRVIKVDSSFKLLDTMALWENLLMVQAEFSGGPILNPAAHAQTISALFSDFGIDLDPYAPAGSLSPLYRCIFSLILAWKSRANIILLDDFSLNCNYEEHFELKRIIRRLTNEGVTFILTSLHGGLLKLFCDRIAFMVNGRIVDCFENLTHNQAVIDEAILKVFSSHSYRSNKPSSNIGGSIDVSPLFEAHSPSVTAPFLVQRGEITAVADMSGAFTKSINATFSLSIDGSLLLRANPVSLNGALKAEKICLIDAGASFETVSRMTPAENLCLGMMDRVSTAGVIKKRMTDFMLSEFADWYGDDSILKCDSGTELGYSLRLAMSLYKIVHTHPSLLICFNFSNSVEQGAQWVMQECFYELAQQGCAVIVLTSGQEKIEDFANRYTLVRSDRKREDLSYNQICSRANWI